jgi:hypothetical protein
MVCDVCIYMSLICVWLINKVIDFKFPDKGELERISKKERLNLFRRYFAASRYNRLLIQKNLIKSAYNESSPSEILELERSHNQDFFDKVRIVKEYAILDEFIDAAKEEEYGLQKIIEAYDKRIMNQSLS